MVVAFQAFLRLSPESSGAASWISFAALLVRRCLQTFKTLFLEKTVPPRSYRKRFLRVGVILLNYMPEDA